MTTFEILTAIQDSALAHAISKTDHLVGAVLQIVHVIGLILFLASIVLIALRSLGWVLSDQSIADVAKSTSKLMWTGLVFTAISGTLMFVATPKLYFYNSAFGVKMLLMLVAIVVQATLFRRVAKNPSVTPAFARASVGACVACWFGVAMAGRMIGFV
jgi:hypothetical protein